MFMNRIKKFVLYVSPAFQSLYSGGQDRTPKVMYEGIKLILIESFILFNQSKFHLNMSKTTTEILKRKANQDDSFILTSLALTINLIFYLFYQFLKSAEGQMSQSRQEPSSYEFLLKVIAVKMKIKFPCRMTLQLNKQVITKQVSSGDTNKFLFNEEIVLRGEDGNSFQILAHLYTDKGTKYTSGVFKLLADELIRSQGERLVAPLNKCLDPDAFCEIKVDQVINLSKNVSKVGRSSSKILISPEKQDLLSPQVKRINSEKYMIGETRSQVNIGQAGGSYAKGSEENRVRETTKTQVFKTFTKSPTSRFTNMKYVAMNSGNVMKNLSEFPVEQVGSQRPSFVETQVYRDGYYKLKQKFKKQSEIAKEESHKRMLLQANQNNYKLQIMKLKLKGDEQEKQINDKNEKIKAINTQLIELQKKDIDISYLKEENSNLERKLRISQENSHTLQQDIESVKKIMVDRLKLSQQGLSAMRHQLEFAKAKIEEQKYEFDSQIKAKDNIILGKNNDLKMRADTIQRQKKLIKDLQEQVQTRIFQFQKSLSTQRAAMQLKIDDIKTKKAFVEKQKEELNRNNSEIQQQIEKHKNTISLLQYNKKMLSEENILQGQNIAELILVKQKYVQLQKEYKFLEQQFETIRRNLQMAVQNKEININELVAKFDEGKQRQQKIKAEYEQRIKTLLVKTQQIQLSLDNSKNTLERNKRTIQGLIKENSALRDQNQLLREEIKTVQKRIINLEGQYATNFSKYDRQNSNFKFLLEKYKQDKNALQKQNDNLKQRLQKNDEKIKLFQDIQRQAKVKQRHLEQRLEKELAKAKENQEKYEISLKQAESNIAQLNLTIDLLQKEAKKHIKSINQNQLTAIKTKETHQLMKKSIKLSEEKIISFQTQIKAKNQELNEFLQKAKVKQFKIHEYEHEVSKLKEDIVQHTNQSIKQQKIIELLKNDIEKLKKSQSQLQNTIFNKQTNQERLRQEVKLTRDQHAKQKIRGNKIQSEFDKFKDSINDIIHIEFTRILKVPNSPKSTQKITERLRQSQVSIARSQKSKPKAVVDPTQLTNTLAQKLHETKNGLWKMAELNRALKIQNEKLMQQSQTLSNRHEFNQLQLHRDIQLLEDQMNNIISDKEEQCLNYDHMLIVLNDKLKEKEMVIQDLKGENQQLSAINTGLKTDFQTNNDLNDKKVNCLKANITELNEKIQYLNFNLGCLEDKNHEYQEKTIQQQNQIVTHKQLLIKFEKSVRDLKENQQKLNKQIQTLKKQCKTLNQKCSESEILLNTQRQTKEKYVKMLEEQQKKTQKQNEFISSLIVQKQSAIKNQLQKSEEANTLQNKVFDLSHQNQTLQDQNQINKKKIQQFKEQVKILSKSVKSLEKQLVEQKGRHVRSIQKIKQRQNDLQIKKSYIKDLQDKYRELRDKNYKQIKELSNELEDKSAASVTEHKQQNDKLLKLQSESKRVWQQNIVLKNEIQNLTKQIYKKNDQIQDLQTQGKKLREDKVNLEDQLTSKQFIIHQKLQEIEKLQQFLQSQRVNFNNFSNQYQLHEKQFNLNIAGITNQFNFKIQSATKEYEQKLQLGQRESDFIRQKLKNTEEQLIKIQLQKKSQQIDFDHQRKMYEQKLKKFESERLATTLAKNNEIKKISEESKNYFERLKQKEAELRQANFEFQQIKLTAGRTQQVNNHSLQQVKTKEKLLEKQIQGLKKKEEHNNNYKKQLLESLYKNQADVRKTIATTVKKVTQICSKSDSEKVLSVIKGLQGGVIRAMMANLQIQ